jgi:hypothetical protein
MNTPVLNRVTFASVMVMAALMPDSWNVRSTICFC